MPAAEARDYEGLVRKLYSDEPDYERQWPVEFKVRVIEGLLQDLASAASDLGDQMGSPYFADQVEFGWATAGAEHPLVDGIKVTPFTPVPPAPRSATQVRDELRTYIGAFQFLDRSVFKPKDAHELADGGFEAKVSIELSGRERAGAWRRDAGSAVVQFHKIGAHWQITRFAVTTYETQRAAELAFDDVTDAWLANVSAPVHSLLRTRSGSDELHATLLDEKHPPPAALDQLLPLAMDSHPGVVVVDIDGDGFDDLFVWDVRGTSVLLHNDAGHGFSDRSDQYGLALEGVNAAAFADLDGNGTLDLVVGRWFGHSEIRFAAGGTFWPGASGRFSLPSQVASISVVDIDGDGRLDLFLATAAHDFHEHLAALLDGNAAAVANLDPGERAQLEQALPAAKAARAAARSTSTSFSSGPATSS